MPEADLRDQRLHSIEERRAQAAELLSIATHNTVKEQVHLAQRDLDEAHSWLLQAPSTSHPSVLGIVELILELATWRLNLVQDAVRVNGPNGTLIANPFPPL